jgi:hypothetical protein
MALAKQPSIFSGRIGSAEIDRSREIGASMAAVAKQRLDADAEFQLAIADTTALREAAVGTGLETEIIQDEIAKLALNPKTYKDYLEYKGNVLGSIRAEVMRTYISTARMYEGVGYSKEHAGKIAADVAKDVKASQMKIYHILFPHSGEKVRATY